MAKLSITVEQITEIVQKLNTSSNEIEKIWNSIKTTEVSQIKESWIGKDCDAYVSKVEEMDADVQKALKAQRLLAQTFEKAKTQITTTQENVASKINNI